MMLHGFRWTYAGETERRVGGASPAFFLLVTAGRHQGTTGTGTGTALAMAACLSTTSRGTSPLCRFRPDPNIDLYYVS